jgi:hypothetical protein
VTQKLIRREPAGLGYVLWPRPQWKGGPSAIDLTA